MSNLYGTWNLKQELPEPFAGIVQKCKGRRSSLKNEDCSKYNTVRAKSATLHPPTLQAILWLLGLMDGRKPGAAGHQDSNGEVNFYCLEYPKPEGACALVYNSRNGKVKGFLQKKDGMEPLSPVSVSESSGEEYMALFAYLSIDGGGSLGDTEFASHFFEIHEYFAGHKELD